MAFEATASETTASEATASEATASEATDSEATAFEATASEAKASEATASEATVSEAIGVLGKFVAAEATVVDKCINCRLISGLQNQIEIHHYHMYYEIGNSLVLLLVVLLDFLLVHSHTRHNQC